MKRKSTEYVRDHEFIKNSTATRSTDISYARTYVDEGHCTNCRIGVCYIDDEDICGTFVEVMRTEERVRAVTYELDMVIWHPKRVANLVGDEC